MVNICDIALFVNAALVPGQMHLGQMLVPISGRKAGAVTWRGNQRARARSQRKAGSSTHRKVTGNEKPLDFAIERLNS